MRLTIEITDEQHRYVKSSAALEGKTIQDYVLERALSNSSDVLEEDEDMREIMNVLEPRIESAKRGNIVKVGISDIKEAAMKKVKASK